jgi:hypothetical protein
VRTLTTVPDQNGSAIGEIIDHGFEILRSMKPFLDVDGKQLPTEPELVVNYGLCLESSDAFTRAAHNLGIVATREVHEGHYITSFAPLDASPSETDLILCATWGQFNPALSQQEPDIYVGPRRDIGHLVGSGPENYGEGYSVASLVYRQAGYTRPTSPDLEYVWLRTTSNDLMQGRYPVGFIPPDSLPRELWEFPGQVFGNN